MGLYEDTMKIVEANSKNKAYQMALDYDKAIEKNEIFRKTMDMVKNPASFSQPAQSNYTPAAAKPAFSAPAAPKPDKSAIQAQNYNRLMNLAAESGFAANAAQRARAGELASGRDFVVGTAPSSFGTERVDYGVKSIGQTGIGAVPQIAATAKQTAENAAAAANSKEYAANRARLFMLQNGLSDIPEYDKRKEQEAAIKEQLNTVIQNEELNKAVDKNTFGMKMLRGAKESQERALAGLNPTEQLIGSSLISVGQNAAMLPTALINPAAPLVGMGAIASADKMYELSERGIGAGEAFTRGVVSGAIEAATEKIPLDNMLTMLKSASGREVIKNILRQMGTEAGEEAVSYIANYVADKAANDPQASFSPSELAQVAAAGAISGGIMGGAGTAIGTLRSGGAEKIYALTEQKLQENASQAENTANSQTIGNMESEKNTLQMQQIIKEYLNSTNNKIVEYVNRIRQNPNSKEVFSLGTVSDKKAKDIADLIGFNPLGYTEQINPATVIHIDNRHGINGNADNSMADTNDIARIKYVIDNYDSIALDPTRSKAFSDKNGKAARKIVISKRVNGTYYVIEAVLESAAKKLHIVSAYKKKAAQQAPLTNAVGSTSINAPIDTASINSTVAQPSSTVNTQHMQNSAEDAQVMKSKPLASLKRQFEPHEQPINTRRELGGSAINRIGEAGAFDNVKTLLLTAENERENREKQKEKTATIATPSDMKRGRKNIEDAISGFTRKIVDSGERVDKIAKAVGDDVLYPLYNNARQARSAAMNNIGVAQTDLQGRKVGKSVADIVTPIKAKGERYWEAFQQYVYHLHNIDSMTLETRGANILYNELQNLVEQNPILANIETADEKTLKEIKNSPQYRAVFNEWQKIYARMKGIKNKPVFGRKITAEDSQSIVSTLEMAYPGIAKEAQQIFDYYKNMMRDNVSAGLISEKERQTLEMLYPHYVPVMTNSPRVSISSKDNVARVEDVHKARTTNERMLLPIDEAMARKTLSSIAAQKRNLFGIRLLEHALTNLDKTGRDVVSISDSDLPYDIDAEEAPDLSNKFTVWVDGETVDMAVSPELMEGVRAIMPKPSDKNYAAELVAGTMNLFKKSVTSHNPFFAVTNALKDFQDAMFYTKQNPVKFAANYKKAYEEIATGGELWELYRAMGGVGNSYFNYGEGVELPNYRGIKKLGAKIEGINLMVEQAPRLAEFIDIVEKGGRGYENLQKALLAAADITVNFGRSGEWGKNLNKYAVAFFNPAVQGTSKWKRALLSKNGKRAAALMITKAALLSMLPTLFNEWWWYDDEEYQMLTDSVKDNYYLFKMSNGIWLRIPKGRALMPLANLASRTYRMARGDEKAWEGYLQSTLGAIAPNNPFTDNIIMPLYEAQLFNPKSAGKTWYGGDIESMAMQNLEPRDRTDEYTSDIANIVGKTLNVSPKKIHHVLDSYTGVWGDMLLPTTAPGVTGAWPLIDRFYTDVTFKNRLASDYYSALDEVTQQKNSKPTPAAYAQYDALNDFEKDISDANKRIKNLQNSDMSRFKKADAVKEARKELNEIYREALEEAQAAKEKAEEEFKAIPPEAFERAVRAADSATGTKEIKNGKERTVPLSLARNQKAAIDKATPELNRRQREAIYMMLGINEKVW